MNDALLEAMPSMLTGCNEAVGKADSDRDDSLSPFELLALLPLPLEDLSLATGRQLSGIPNQLFLFSFFLAVLMLRNLFDALDGGGGRVDVSSLILKVLRSSADSALALRGLILDTDSDRFNLNLKGILTPCLLVDV
jgi:hypothetical protein